MPTISKAFKTETETQFWRSLFVFSFLNEMDLKKKKENLREKKWLSLDDK